MLFLLEFYRIQQKAKFRRNEIYYLRLELFKSLRKCKRRFKGMSTLKFNSNKIMLCGVLGATFSCFK